MAANQSLLPSANCILVQQSKKERIELGRERGEEREKALCVRVYVREREKEREQEREAAGVSHNCSQSWNLSAAKRRTLKPALHFHEDDMLSEEHRMLFC